MNINEYLEKTFELMPDLPFDFVKIRPSIICVDGEYVSVQASKNHYCSPRENLKTGYISVELGYPSFEDERLIKYAEQPECPLKTVYGWTPVELIDTILSEHGGIDYERSMYKYKKEMEAS